MRGLFRLRAFRGLDVEPEAAADAHDPRAEHRSAAFAKTQSSQVKSGKSQNGESMPIGVPPGDGPGEEPVLGVGSLGEGVVPLALGPTPGRKRPKLLNGGFVPRSSGPS